VPPGSGRSVYQSIGGPVCTAPYWSLPLGKANLAYRIVLQTMLYFIVLSLAFYAAELLRPDFSGGEDVGRLAVNEMLEV
ncbi:hypothetical protein B296_00028999, partial [Ensete ventricosum]